MGQRYPHHAQYVLEQSVRRSLEEVISWSGAGLVEGLTLSVGRRNVGGGTGVGWGARGGTPVTMPGGGTRTSGSCCP